jgi:hypothetical protein
MIAGLGSGKDIGIAGNGRCGGSGSGRRILNRRLG